MLVIAGEESRKEIQSAIEEWNQKTCLQFREKNDADTDYIEFVYDEGQVPHKTAIPNQLPL